MSDVDPTPTTPVTIGDRLGWFRGDLAARLDALSGQLATQHTELLAAINAIGDGVTLAQLRTAIQAGASGGATEATAAAILAAIGDLSTYPAGWTVRALLAQISAVIDTAPTDLYVPVDPMTCEYPYAFSGACKLVPTNDFNTIDSINYRMYAVSFPALSPMLTNGSYYIATNPDYVGIGKGYAGVRTCITWDLAGYNQVAPYYCMNIAGTNTTATLAYSYIDINSPVMPDNCFNIQLDPPNFYCYQSMFIGIADDLAASHPLNGVWLHISGVPWGPS
jgi:hypothetical protein